MPFSFLLGLGHSDLYFPKCSSPQLARTLIFQDLSICQFENNGVFFPPLELCLRAYFTCVLKATLTRNSGLGKSPNYLFIFPIRIICLIALASAEISVVTISMVTTCARAPVPDWTEAEGPRRQTEKQLEEGSCVEKERELLQCPELQAN